MPDKLTDSEIVKALEYWREFDNEIDEMLQGEFKDNKMLYKQKGIVKITFKVFDLINQLQAENERLKGHPKDGFFNLLGNCLVFSKTLKDYNDMRKGLKAEAIKEFVERLKERADKLKHISIDGKWAISQYDVDRLLKEKVGSDLF